MSGLSKVLSVRKVTYDTSVPVYDIEVPKYSNFVLSNGLVVHNSKDASDSVAGAVYEAWLDVSDGKSHGVANVADAMTSIYDDDGSSESPYGMPSRSRYRSRDLFEEIDSIFNDDDY